MTPTVAQLFDAGARDYDQLRRGLVSCFDDFYGARFSKLLASSPKLLTSLALPAASSIWVRAPNS